MSRPDPTLALIRALARRPASTAQLARRYGPRLGCQDADNAMYRLLRGLEALGVARRCAPPEGIARGRGKPAQYWRLAVELRAVDARERVKVSHMEEAA